MMGLYDVYESKQRKVFWKKARQKIRRDLKKDPDTYGKDTEPVLSFAIDIKKIWKEPERLRMALYKILTDMDNISESDIKDIMKETRINDKEKAINMFKSRVETYLKLDINI